MHIRSDARIGEIAASAREAARLFDTLGIDYVCHGNLSLDDACADLHLDPRAVGYALLRLQPEVASGRQAPASLAEVVRDLTAAGFPAIQYRLGRVGADVAEVAAGLRANNRTADSLRRASDELASRINDHLLREQSDLLPRLGSLSPGERAAIGQQLAVCIAEHFAITTGIAELRAAIDDVEKVRPACARLRAAVRDLESEMRQHMHLENNVLFPRVVPLADA